MQADITGFLQVQERAEYACPELLLAAERERLLGQLLLLGVARS